MRQAQDQFIHRANVINFRRQLTTLPGDAQRKVLMDLIAEECRQGLERGWPPTLD